MLPHSIRSAPPVGPGAATGARCAEARPADAQHLVGRQGADDDRAGPRVGGEHRLRVQRDAHVPEARLRVAQEHQVAGQHVGGGDRRRDGEQVRLVAGQRDARGAVDRLHQGAAVPRLRAGRPGRVRRAERVHRRAHRGERLGRQHQQRAWAAAGSCAAPRCAPPPAAATGTRPAGSPAGGFASCAAGGGATPAAVSWST